MWKYLSAWAILPAISIANDTVQDFTYGKYVNELTAHQLSTLTCVLLLGIVIRGYVRFLPLESGRHALLIGLLWMVGTVTLDSLFFHYVAGDSWSELLSNYNLLDGRLEVLELVWIAIAPLLFFRFARSADRRPS